MLISLIPGILKKQEIKTAYALAKRLGIATATAKRLIEGKVPETKTIEVVCREFKLTPNDVIEYVIS